MAWLLGRQDRIQKKLADRHLAEGGIALFDLTSSYFEGVCVLWRLWDKRDAKKGKLGQLRSAVDGAVPFQSR